MKRYLALILPLQLVFSTYDNSEFDRLKSLSGISMVQFFTQRTSPAYQHAVEDIALNEFRPKPERFLANAILGDDIESMKLYEQLYPYEKDEALSLMIKGDAIVSSSIAESILSDTDVLFDLYHLVQYGREPYSSLMETNMKIRTDTIVHFVDRLLGFDDTLDSFKNRWRHLLFENSSALAIELNIILNMDSDEKIARALWKLLREEVVELSGLPDQNITFVQDTRIVEKASHKFAELYPLLKNLTGFIKDMLNVKS